MPCHHYWTVSANCNQGLPEVHGDEIVYCIMWPGLSQYLLELLGLNQTIWDSPPLNELCIL